MKPFSAIAAGDYAGASNRRQPVRQARTNPAKTSSNVSAAVGSNAQPLQDVDDGEPGFYPALTHFTNAIDALPKEMIRHYTMLKEVDAKIYGPGESLRQLFTTALKFPPYQRPQKSIIQEEVAKSDAPASLEQHDFARRESFNTMRSLMSTALTILDEKNHVMNIASDALDKQLMRCQSSYSCLDTEISEEARYGSMNHWAYTDKTGEKKSILVGERTRRQANQAEDAAANRSELRRDAVAQRKRNHHIESDFDEGRTMGKKTQPGASKGRKTHEPNPGASSLGLGINTATAPSSKRRKIEKPPIGGFQMERAMSSTYTSNAGNTKGNGKEITSANMKKSKVSSLATNGVTRRRGNTNASGVNSPVASSPTMGTFAISSKTRNGKSPAPSMQRAPSIRQNSSHNVLQQARNSSSSTNHKKTSGNGMHGSTADVDNVSGLTGRSVNDVKDTMKATTNAKGEHLVEDIGGDGAGDMRGGLLVGSKSNHDRQSKREDLESSNGSRNRGDRPASISTRGAGSKPASANPTPNTSTFGEGHHRSRASRNNEVPAKRSHKKGAGLAAQLAAAQAAEADDGTSGQGDDDEEDDENEPRYCYCNQVSFGEMVGCDSDECKREWFHLQCVGLTKAPAKNAKWYCDECKEVLKKNKFNGSTGR